MAVSAPLPPALFTESAAAVEKSERSLRIVLVSQYFPPEVGATQTRMQTFAEYLAARGHEVTVICEFPNHPHGVIPSEYRGRILEDDRSNPYRVLRVWVKANQNKTQRTRLAFYLSYMGLATVVAPLAGRADVVFASSPPLFVAVAGAAIAKMKRAPFVLDVRDLWPVAAVALGEIREGRVLRITEAVERSLYRQAAVVLAVTRPFCGHIDRVRGRPPHAVFLPNGTLDFFSTETSRSFRSELGVSDNAFLVTFAGTHGIAQALPTVLDAAERADGKAEFAFVGEGPAKEKLVADAEQRGLRNVHFHPEVPLQRVPEVLAASDAMLVTLSAHPSFADFVPSKLVDFMAAGRPVVLAAAGEAVRILKNAHAGVIVPPEDPGALASAVGWLADHPSERAAMSDRGRRYARRWPRVTQAERLETLLVDVAGDRRR